MKSGFIAFTLFAALGTTACHRAPQQRAAEFLRKGKNQMSRKDYARATLDFRNAVQLLPQDAEAAYQLSLAYLAQGNTNQGIAFLFRATRLDPRHAGANTKLAELMARSGDPALAKEGEKRMRTLLESAPANVEALDALALSELQLGEFEDAETHLKEALRRLPNDLSSSMDLAQLYLRRQEYQKAEQVLKEVQAAAPQSVAAAISLGQFYMFTAQLPKAEGAFKHALDISSADSDALFGFATVERRLGKKEQAEQSYRELARLPDERYRHLHAAYLFAEGQVEQSLREFEKLAKESPPNRESRNRLVSAYLLTGRIADAEKVLESALKAHPNDADALFQRSQILMRSGKTNEAEDDLNRVLHIKPDSAEAHYLLAHIYQSQGKRSQQSAELNQALHYNPALLPARIALADLLVVSGSSSAALDILNSAPKEQRQALSLLVARNLANYAAGDKASFRQGVEQALRIGPIPEVLLQDAVMKLGGRDYAGARVSIEQALKQSPDNIRALRAEALSYTAQKQPKEADQFLRNYAAQSKSAPVERFVGEWFWSTGDHGEARAFLNRAKTLDPKYLPATLTLAEMDIAEGRAGDAVAALNQVVTAQPNYFAGYVLLATAETKLGLFDSAIEHYRKALELQSGNATVLNNLAYLLADKADQPDSALSYAQQAVEAAPGNADACGTLGWVFYQKGLYREAQQQLQVASEADRNSTQLNAVIRRYHLAMTYAKLGDEKRGAEVLVEALRENPNLPEAEMARSLFR